MKKKRMLIWTIFLVISFLSFSSFAENKGRERAKERSMDQSAEMKRSQENTAERAEKGRSGQEKNQEKRMQQETDHHTRRMAQIDRITQLAEEAADSELIGTAKELKRLELIRHHRMILRIREEKFSGDDKEDDQDTKDTDDDDSKKDGNDNEETDDDARGKK